MGFKENLIELTDGKILFDEPMKFHTTVGVGGVAKYYAEPDSLYVLVNLIEQAKLFGKKYKIIGNGSKLLVSDQGYYGLIISLKKLKDIFFKPDCLRAMAGVNISELINFCALHGLGGTEALCSIPATVGGAVVMNAGAFGYNISDHILRVETVLDGKIKKYSRADCNFGYRTSRFKKGKEVVVAVDFNFPKIDKNIFATSVKNFTDIRRALQPTGKTFGSVFKNPKGYFAGALIEDVGLKGYKIGGASVSNKHANFIIADKTATAKDFYLLINLIKERVKASFDVTLTEEVIYVGNFDDING